MRVAFFDLEEWQGDYIQRQLTQMGLAGIVQVQYFTDHLTPEVCDSIADAEAVGVFVWTKLTAEVLARLPHLRLILTMSTGYDHIDLETCRARGITVCNVPHYGENTVAEHTFALILSLSRKLHEAYFQTIRGEFRIRDLRGFDLYGKTLGVVGAGNIGLHVIRIDRETLSKVKRGALLINTARGSVVDTEALLWALDHGILAGAGLDVIEGEEYITEESALWRLPPAEQTLRNVVQAHMLLKRENVVFTPHIAFNSHEAIRRILDTTLENLRAFLQGRPQNSVVSPPPHEMG